MNAATNAMTEEEARTKWCPFARTSRRYENGGLAIEQTDGDAKCIASGCACWRWKAEVKSLQDPKWTYEHGYCGLASK